MAFFFLTRGAGLLRWFCSLEVGMFFFLVIGIFIIAANGDVVNGQRVALIVTE